MSVVKYQKVKFLFQYCTLTTVVYWDNHVCNDDVTLTGIIRQKIFILCMRFSYTRVKTYWTNTKICLFLDLMYCTLIGCSHTACSVQEIFTYCSASVTFWYPLTLPYVTCKTWEDYKLCSFSAAAWIAHKWSGQHLTSLLREAWGGGCVANENQWEQREWHLTLHQSTCCVQVGVVFPLSAMMVCWFISDKQTKF